MIQTTTSRLPELLARHETDIAAEWAEVLLSTGVVRKEMIKDSEVREQCTEMVKLMRQAASEGNVSNVDSRDWIHVKEMLANVARTRGLQGFTPTEVAMFIFSLKEPLFRRLQDELRDEPAALVSEIWLVSELLDKLGLWTTEVYQKSREEVILRQQEDMLELSTPVVKLWEGILALPIIGTLDSARTQVVMENLLQAIVSTGAEVAIIDITGVPTVDTLVSQHLLKAVAAARLMGADCIISGIRPQIAQTIVHLGVDLTDVTTKATLADAFTLALAKTGATIGRSSARH